MPDSKTLMQRICNGYMWLRDPKNENDPHYKEALDLYDSLVDQLPPGVKESDCWPATIEDAQQLFLTGGS